MSTQRIIVCDLCSVATSDPIARGSGVFGERERLHARGWKRFGNVYAPRLLLDVCPICMPVTRDRPALYLVDDDPRATADRKAIATATVHPAKGEPHGIA